MAKVGRGKGVPTTLDEAAMARGVSVLAKRDRDLARVVAEYGQPQMWEREQGFETLVLTIFEQQVSLASAAATHGRLLAAARELTPERVARMSEAEVRAAGITRQKAAYLKDLARRMVEGELDLNALERLDDDAARAELMKVKGVGAWTAEVYLLRALRRPDAWPAGDLALAIAAERVKGLPSRPSAGGLIELAEAWRPLRAVAARILWQFYLHAPK
jgi:DNA-3-methyladenine glycosylase II